MAVQPAWSQRRRGLRTQRLSGPVAAGARKRAAQAEVGHLSLNAARPGARPRAGRAGPPSHRGSLAASVAGLIPGCHVSCGVL